jgi:ketosteroid isomerase-like protein
MSAEENVKLLQVAYEAFGRGDIPAVMEHFSDEIEWVEPENEHIPMAGTFRGKNGVGQFFTLLGEHIDFQQFEPREFTAQGDRVAVMGHAKSTVKSTGKQTEFDFLHYYYLKNGKVIRFQEFSDTHQTAEAFKK